jgi:PqqD family protein of HPr-rel-A system
MAIFVWHLRDPSDLLTQRWGADVLVWHQRAGDTHLLSGPGAAVYERLRQGAASTEELHQAIGRSATGGTPDRPALEATLQDMMRLGLVTAHPL